MPSMAIHWDQGDVARLQSCIRQEIALTGREASEAVKHAFLVFGISGRANTKRGVNLRQVFPNPDRNNPNARTKRGKRPAPFLIQYLYQSRPPRLAPARRKSDPRRRIRMRGLARASWGWMMQRIFSGRVEANPYRIAKHSVMSVVDGTKRGTNPFVDFHDKLVYLLKVHPDVGRVAMAKAANRMQHQLDGRMKSEMQRVWHS